MQTVSLTFVILKYTILELLPAMFVASTRLSIRRPSPTTVLFTVSNASPRTTVAAQAFFYITWLFRVLTILCIGLLLLTKSQCITQKHGVNIDTLECPSWLPNIIPTQPATATRISWQNLAPASFVVLFLCFRRFHTGMIQISYLAICMTELLECVEVWFDLTNLQKNHSSSSVHSEFKLQPLLALILVPPPPASSRHHRFRTYLSMKPSRASKSVTTLPL